MRHCKDWAQSLGFAYLCLLIGMAYAAAAETIEFVDELWAKSPPGDSDQQESGYPLLPHLLDVAAVAASLIEAVPCPVALPMAEPWIVALVGLHDLGKASPGFQ